MVSAKQRLQFDPDVLHHPLLLLGRRMDAVALEGRGVERKSREQEGHERRVLRTRNLAEGGCKRVRVGLPVIGRDLHPDQQHPGARIPGGPCHRLEVRAHVPYGQAAQSVIAAQLEDDDAGTVLTQQRRQARQSPARGVAADAGIDDAILRRACRYPPGKTGHPAAATRKAEFRREAVAHHEDRTAAACSLYGRSGQAEGKQQDQARAGQPLLEWRREAGKPRMETELHALEARSLTKIVADASGPLVILDDINLDVAAGESLAVLGASGSGKSTLLSLLAGLDVPSSGRVTMFGTDLTALDEDGRARLRARHLGFVFQSFQLLPHLTALENVMLPLEITPAAEDGSPHARALRQLERVGLASRAAHTPATLSGGEQQRVALARAFVARPGILLADEPTGSLDAATGEQVADLLFDLQREAGTTLVLVTHDPALAARCQRRIELHAGRMA
jgi:putative ABC transport system ATP-binding protein